MVDARSVSSALDRIQWLATDKEKYLNPPVDESAPPDRGPVVFEFRKAIARVSQDHVVMVFSIYL